MPSGVNKACYHRQVIQYHPVKFEMYPIESHSKFYDWVFKTGLIRADRDQDLLRINDQDQDQGWPKPTKANVQKSV